MYICSSIHAYTYIYERIHPSIHPPTHGHRPRLARNLLQNVIRRWYARLPEICTTAGGLTTNAEESVGAFKVCKPETYCWTYN